MKNWNEDVWTDDDYKKQSEIKKQNILNSLSDPVEIIKRMQEENFLQDEIEHELKEFYLEVYLIDLVNENVELKNRLETALSVGADLLEAKKDLEKQKLHAFNMKWLDEKVNNINKLTDKINGKAIY